MNFKMILTRADATTRTETFGQYHDAIDAAFQLLVSDETFESLVHYADVKYQLKNLLTRRAVSRGNVCVNVVAA